MDVAFLLCALLGLTLAFVIHEYCHGLAAYTLGDPTPKYEGRLSPNPLIHLDPVGSVVMFASMVTFHGRMTVGWARPVRFDMSNLKGGHMDAALIAGAGPLSNFVVVFLAALPFQVGLVPRSLELPLYCLISANLGFGLFNCLPWPPLDGWKILGGVMPTGVARQMHDFEHKVGIWGVVVLLLASGVLVNPILQPVFSTLLSLCTSGLRL